VNWSAGPVGVVPSGVTTVTATVPAPGGLIAVIWVPESMVKFWAGVPPKLTAVAPVKSAPVMVTVSPPSALPPLGEGGKGQRSLGGYRVTLGPFQSRASRVPLRRGATPDDPAWARVVQGRSARDARRN